MMVFMVQGASAGIIGAILGAALGALLASQLNNLMPIIGVLLDGAALPVAIEPLQVIVIALVAMAIALLSTLYPSWRAAATQPAEALRYTAVDFSGLFLANQQWHSHVFQGSKIRQQVVKLINKAQLLVAQFCFRRRRQFAHRLTVKDHIAGGWCIQPAQQVQCAGDVKSGGAGASCESPPI